MSWIWQCEQIQSISSKIRCRSKFRRTIVELDSRCWQKEHLKGHPRWVSHLMNLCAWIRSVRNGDGRASRSASADLHSSFCPAKWTPSILSWPCKIPLHSFMQFLTRVVWVLSTSVFWKSEYRMSRFRACEDVSDQNQIFYCDKVQQSKLFATTLFGRPIRGSC